jgi:hypothetical protein
MISVFNFLAKKKEAEDEIEGSGLKEKKRN